MISVLLGVFSILLYLLNTCFWFPMILILGLLKVIAGPSLRNRLSQLVDAVALNWLCFNHLNQRITSNTQLRVSLPQTLKPSKWYMVIANHQSWVDILVLQRALHGKIPILKFFLKKELIWVPMLGLAWWALDFPFMQRFSRQFLKKNPHLKGKDIETTRKACQRFEHKPVSIMNFVEGTRFTPAKHQHQQSPYQHLLTPKAGGLAFTLSAMGGQLQHLVNVTIHYPQGTPSFWDFACGKVDTVNIEVDMIPIDDALVGDYFEDDAFRSQFQSWLNQLWHDKDHRLNQLTKPNKRKAQPFNGVELER
jgi:1-acyl-sn-glycerol-3-phosphate acyltransferase